MKLKTKSDYVIFIIGVVIIVFLAYFLLFRKLFKNEYQRMEDNLVSNAKDYVKTNGIDVNKEIYLDAKKIGINLDEKCSYVSGVIYDGENYTPYLSCSEYKSNAIPNNKTIREYIYLKGDEVMVLAKGMKYYDPGYICSDIVTKTGNVGTEEGVYNVYYKTNNSNSIAIRKVVIIDNSELKLMFPTIKLNGDEIDYVPQNTNYVEKGVEAIDTYDGNISSRVIIEGNVNTSVIGEYDLSYSVSNTKGYTSYVTRKVTVVPNESDLVVKHSISPENLTNEDVTIKLSVNTDYKKVVYPDGSEGKNLEYIVSKNGKYRFIVYDLYNREQICEVEITNINKDMPLGSCKAIKKYDRTEIKVEITTSREISSYEYNVDGSITTLQTNTFTSRVANPTVVKVKVKDIINNINEMTCTIEKEPEKKIVTDVKGKNCLEGYTCYVQHDYGDSGRYPYCSMPDNDATCGGIGRSGCSITSATNAIAALGVKSSNGQLYNPYTVWDELYPINKKTGKCNGGCSGWSRIRDSIVNAGLTAPIKKEDFNKNNLPMVIENLRKGYPVIIYVQGEPYSKGRGHYMTLLAINDMGYVFLSDSDNKSGTKKAYYNGKQYYVDTWIPTNDLLTGNVKEFLLVGPAGIFVGK